MKEEVSKKRIWGIIIAIFIIAMIFHNFYSLKNIFQSINKGISGSAITDEVLRKFSSLKKETKWIIVTEWLVVISIALIFLIKAKIKYNREKRISESSIKQNHVKKSGQKTDIDVLYELLQEKKMLRVGAIADYFKVSKDIAIEWCEILEENELATIDYPTVGDPKIMLSEEEVNKEEKIDEKKQKKQ